jgi:hypothetical protein
MDLNTLPNVGLIPQNETGLLNVGVKMEIPDEWAVFQIKGKN